MPISYCVKIDYVDGTAYSDSDYIIERILLKDETIRYIGDNCFLFEKKSTIPIVFEKVYREFGHIKEIIEMIGIMHISKLEEANLDVLFDKSILH